MRIAMMQMAMTEDMERNLQVSYEAVKEAAGVDLLFFPEVQHMPFLLIDEKGNLLGKSASSSVLTAICRKASALALPWGPNWS